MSDSSAISLLKRAIVGKRVDVLRSLLSELSTKQKEFHEVVDSICTESGCLLHYVTEIGDADAVRALLCSGANPCVQNDAGKTPMQICPSPEIANIYVQEFIQAVAQSKLGRICQMLSSGVPIDAVDSPATKNTALHYAASYGSHDVIRVLCEGGSNPNSLNAKGDTPLHDAVERGDLNIVKQLLHYGANPYLRNNGGRDCYDIAKERAGTKPEILQCLSMHSLASGDNNNLNAKSKKGSLESLLSNDSIVINGGPAHANKADNFHAKESPSSNTTKSLTNSTEKSSAVDDANTCSPLGGNHRLVMSNFADIKIENWTDYLWPQPKRIHLSTLESCFRLPDRKLRIFMLAGSQLNFREVMHIWNLHGPQYSAMQISIQFEYQVQKMHSECGSGLSCGVFSSLFQIPESYSLQIQESGVELLAGDARGLKHGASTLSQIVRIFQQALTAEDRTLTLPCLSIKDWPDTSYRACLIDFTGCRVFSTDTLLKLAGRMAYLKANQLVVHFEQRIQDRHFSVPYSQKELFQLRQHCADMLLELVPSLDINCEELESRMATDLLQKFFERFSDCRTVHFGTNFAGWLIRNPETFVVAMPPSVQHIYLSVKNATSLNRQKLQNLPPICTLCIQAAQVSTSDRDRQDVLYDASGLCLTFPTSEPGYLCQAPEEMIRNAVLAARLGEKFSCLAMMCCDLSTGCEIVPQSLAYMSELAVLGVGWNRRTDMARFCFLMPHVAAEHVLGDRKMTILFRQILNLGNVEHELTKLSVNPTSPIGSNNAGSRKPSSSSITSGSFARMPLLSVFVQVLLNPDFMDLDTLTPAQFKKARIELNRCLQTLQNLKKELPYNFDLALCVAEVQLISELMVLATKIGQALCLIGSNPRQDFGTTLINVGVANLPLTSRTDLANKLLEVRTQFQHAWLSRNLASTLSNALKIFDNLFKTLLPPALQEYGENLL